MQFKGTLQRKPIQPELVASKDQSRPVLSIVHLNAEASEVWVTDSYMAARFPVDVHEDDTTGPIPLEALKASRKPPSKYLRTEIIVNGDARVRQVNAAGDAGDPFVTFPRETFEYQFPNLPELFSRHESGDFMIGLDAARLYALAKAMGTEEIRLSFSATVSDAGEKTLSNMKPIHVSPLRNGEDEPSGILMPIRIS